LEIDLSDFLAASADRSIPYNYKLHGVLVHSGDVHGGHYFGMIKPEKNSKWYRYDDERVIPVTIDDVLEENFGGDGGNSFSNHNGVPNPQSRMLRNAAQWKRFTSAYMLVYLRESAIDEILSPITETDVPKHVVQKVDDERIEVARRKREKEEMHLFITVRIIDVETFRHHDGVDLASFDPADKEASEYIHSHRVRRDLTWLGFYQHVAESYHLGRDQIRLWHLVNRQNKTVRPDVPIPPDPQISILLFNTTNISY
jgi:ubiquitin carboxyl-terminal hydrolase 7